MPPCPGSWRSQSAARPRGAPRPLPGTVTLRTAHSEITLVVGDDGSYSATVPPDSYAVEGRSPPYDDAKALCRAAGPATATAGTTTRADVYCQEA